jgi:hypothetical protein
LKISDPVIEKEMLLHRGRQFQQIVTAYTVISIFSLLNTIYYIYGKNQSSHPMKIVTFSLSIFILFIMQILCRIGRPELCRFFAVPMFLVHATGAVCTYKEWAPANFNKFPKEEM